MRILIADDDAVSRRLLEKTLERAGYEVLAVDNGCTAAAHLSTAEGPRLALLDWVMPGLDGIAVCREVRKQLGQPYVYIILLTSKIAKEDVLAGFEVGADDYLAKPWDPEELKARLRTGERILQLQNRLIHDAFHDQLTQLPNRALFLDKLGHCVRRAKNRQDYKFAVLFVDLDRFKIVNDSLGHLAGDQLIVEISKRLSRSIRRDDLISRPVPFKGTFRQSGDDTVARLGGDEFTILLDDIKDASDAVRVAERIHRNLASPVLINGHKVFTTASIGITLSESGYTAPEDMLRDADAAMYRAKALGKSRSEIFDTAMHASAVSRLKLEADLRHAIEKKEFRIHYQPIVWLRDGRITGFEALVRWQRPEVGLVFPAEFIPVAEETGLIVSIGKWLLREACRQMHAWNLQFPSIGPLTVAVNISAKEFIQPDLVTQIGQILSETGLAPGNLKLELTESMTMRKAEQTTRILDELKALGVRLSMDDFGTGYSSLSYLRRFPLDTLKIDRSFVSEMDNNKESREIVQTIMTLAHNLHMEVVAEGVETTEQVKQLKSLGCECAQGYLFSKPMNEEQVEVVLTSARKANKLPEDSSSELVSPLG